jgi:hypothetical protein
MALVVGLLVLVILAVPAGAQFYGNYMSNPLSMFGMGGLGGMGGIGGLSSVYGAMGPFGMMGLGGMSGYGSPFGSYGNTYGNSPYGSYYGSPLGSSSNSFPSTDLFQNFGSDSPFGNMFGGSLFKAKQYGPPPEENITKALVGQKLSFNSGYGIPMQYQIEDSDIGDITGTQYKGADAWKVRVGQPGAYWDVILDEKGDKVLAANQVQ